MPAPGATAIDIRHLNHWFGDGETRRMVLRNLDFLVDRDKPTLLVRPSDCGKTTLLTLVGALRSVMEGSVIVLGKELLGTDESTMVETRRRIGFVFQHHNLHRSLTVLQNVRMGLEVKGLPGTADARDRCMEAIAAVGLAEHADKYQDQISGGQKQRAAVARALVGKPDLRLADESPAALDSKTGRDVIELMQRLAAGRGMTALMVTHDTRILDIADRIVEMEDGRILQETANPPASPLVPVIASCRSSNGR